MTVNYATHVSTKSTPQSEPIPGKPMVQNNAGGYAFVLDDWTRLDRWLLLGSEGNTYYQSERKLTQENAQAVLRCLSADGLKTVNRIVEISEAGRAPKNDPAIFALALAMAHGDVATKQHAGRVLPRVCRIPTHLFQFIEAVDQLRGHGRSLRTAIRNWYLSKEPRDLAYQCSKYQSRGKWSHRDVLREFRPKAEGLHNAIFHWCVKGWEGVGEEAHPEKALLPLWAFEKAKRATSKEEIVKLIRDYDLVRECIPTQFLTEASVWEALLEKMPMTAMVRNLATMTRIGLLAPLSNAAGKIISELVNSERIRKSRLHPIALLSALKTYSQGRGERGGNTWTPVQQIVDALDGAFYLAFDNVEVTNRRYLLACDVSGSMEEGCIAGIPGLTPRQGTGAMAMVTAAVEPQHHIVGFTSNGWGARNSMHYGYNSAISPIPISPRMRLDQVCQTMAKLPMGGTDCALPMIYALENRMPVDVFIVYTDNETWAGNIHPTQALNNYRQKMGIPAKLVVTAFTGTEFTIADPNDAGMMDMVGFDASCPALIADFVKS